MGSRERGRLPSSVQVNRSQRVQGKAIARGQEGQKRLASNSNDLVHPAHVHANASIRRRNMPLETGPTY